MSLGSLDNVLQIFISKALMKEEEGEGTKNTFWKFFFFSGFVLMQTDPKCNACEFLEVIPKIFLVWC